MMNKYTSKLRTDKKYRLKKKTFSDFQKRIQIGLINTNSNLINGTSKVTVGKEVEINSSNCSVGHHRERETSDLLTNLSEDRSRCGNLESNVSISNDTDNNINNEDYSDNSDCSFVDGSSLTESDLISDLKLWVIKYNVKFNALKGLLILLRKHKISNLPKDPRSVMRHKDDCVARTVKLVNEKSYIHSVLKNSLSEILNSITSAPTFIYRGPELSLDFNVDGLPLFNSTTKQLWPILCRLVNFESRPFVVGVFCGLSKPENLSFLQDLIMNNFPRQVSLKKYHVAEFISKDESNAIAIIPLEWMVSATVCKYPSDEKAYSVCFKKKSSPAEDWKAFDIAVLFSTDSLPEARDKSKELSDVEHSRYSPPLIQKAKKNFKKPQDGKNAVFNMPSQPFTIGHENDFVNGRGGCSAVVSQLSDSSILSSPSVNPLTNFQDLMGDPIGEDELGFSRGYLDISNNSFRKASSTINPGDGATSFLPDKNFIDADDHIEFRMPLVDSESQVENIKSNADESDFCQNKMSISDWQTKVTKQLSSLTISMASLSTELLNLSVDVKHIKSMTNHLVEQHGQTTAARASVFEDKGKLVNQFIIKDLQSFLQLEEGLSEEAAFASMINYIKGLGGQSLEKAVRKFVRTTLTKEFANTVNWTGPKSGNSSISKTKLEGSRYISCLNAATFDVYRATEVQVGESLRKCLKNYN